MIEKESLPRNEEKLHFLLKLMNLGLNAWSIVDNDSTEEPKLHKTTVKDNIPLLMICLIEDIMAVEMGSKLKEVAVSNLVSSTSKDSIARTLLQYYITELAHARSVERLQIIVPLMRDSLSSLEEVFMHVLVSHLLHYTNEWKQVAVAYYIAY